MDNINFQKELDKLLSNISDKDSKPGIMLHSCCGPCSSYVLDYLKDYFEITVFYYNPNIFPEEEYDHRLAEQKRLIEIMNSKPGHTYSEIRLLTLPYEHSEFTEYVTGFESEPEGGARCSKCFELRLKKTYELAVVQGMDYYGTTLTVSPHKNAILINHIGSSISDDVFEIIKPLWLPSDFKKKEGYKRSIELSKEFDLYRQDYCGCEFALNR